jgi:SpoVK/Ycf46/Vps4 family AAA+-type ATPase
MFALNENIETEKVEENHFIKAISMIKPIITAEMIEYFENFSKKIEI